MDQKQREEFHETMRIAEALMQEFVNFTKLNDDPSVPPREIYPRFLRNVLAGIDVIATKGLAGGTLSYIAALDVILKVMVSLTQTSSDALAAAHAAAV